MNGSTAKLCRRIAQQLAKHPSVLRQQGDRSFSYPEDSERNIYQRLKRAVSRKEITSEKLKKLIRRER